MALSISRGPVAKAQKVVVYGPEGIGKTTLAARFPDPLFIDTEDGTAHYDVARLDPAPASWQALLQAVRDVKAERPCSTLVLDTADWAESMCAAHVIAENSWKSIETPSYGKGWMMLAESFGKLLDALSDVADSGINVVVCAHAKMRKFEQPDEAAGYDRWELKLSKQVAPMVKEWADAVLFLNWKTTVEVVGGGASPPRARPATRAAPCSASTTRAGTPRTAGGFPPRRPQSTRASPRTSRTCAGIRWHPRLAPQPPSLRGRTPTIRGPHRRIRRTPSCTGFRTTGGPRCS